MSNVNKPVIITKNNMGATQYKYLTNLKKQYHKTDIKGFGQTDYCEIEEYNVDSYNNPMHFIQDLFTREIELYVPQQLRKQVRKEYNNRLASKCKLVFY